MAGKLYEMAFKLTAQVGSTFGTTFGNAQKQLSETQKQIAALNRTQSDIAAYQKQQQAVEATNAKLEKYREQLANVQREMSESGEFNSTLANKELELKEKIHDTEAALEGKQRALDETGEKLEKAGVNTAQLSEEERKLAEEMQKLADEQAEAAKGAEQFGESGAGAFSMIGEAVVAAGLNAFLEETISQFQEAAMEAAEYADQIGALSAQYGIAEEDLQAYTYAAELVDVSVETITGSMAKNTKAMYAAMDGTGAQAEAYEQLGVSVVDADGHLRDSETVYWEVIDALGQMTNESERDGIAMTVLGRSAMQLNPLIQAGSSTMKAYAAEAKNVGYTLSGQTLKSLQKLDDQEQRLQNTQLALKNAIGSQLAPAMTKWKELWTNILASVVKFVQKHPIVVNGIAGAATALSLLLKVYLAYKALKVSLIAFEKIHNALKKEDIASTAASALAKEGETAATGGATVAQWALNAAMYACPVLAIVGGIGALIGAVVGFTSTVDDSTESVEGYNSALGELGDISTSSPIIKAPEMSDAEKNTASIKYLITLLNLFTTDGEKAASNAGRVQAILDDLNSKFKGLNLTFDAKTGTFSRPISELRSTLEKFRSSFDIKDVYESYAELIEKEGSLGAQLKELEADYIDAFNAETEGNATERQKAIIDEFEELYDEYRDVLHDESTLEPAMDKADAVAPIYGIIDSIQALNDAYNEAYQAAYDSFTGQYHLWDQADVVAATSVAETTNALQTQTAYWSDYSQDIDLLTGKAGEIEGLSEMIATFADGSPESVNMIAGLADATDEEITAMVKQWKDLKEQQEKAANSLAELKTDYQSQLSEYEDVLRESVEKLDFADEAGEAATDTIDSYIEALKSRTGDIELWAEQIKSIISGAYDVHLENTNPSQYPWGSMFSGYASGTTDATPGLHLVGEYGPELVRMAGGEQVYTAAETRAILSGGGGGKTITIAPQFVVQGSMDESLAEEYAEMVAEMVRDKLDEDDIDTRRGVYV